MGGSEKPNSHTHTWSAPSMTPTAVYPMRWTHSSSHHGAWESGWMSTHQITQNTSHWSRMTGTEHNKWDLIRLNVWLCLATENINRDVWHKNSRELYCHLTVSFHFYFIYCCDSDRKCEQLSTLRARVISRSLKMLENNREYTSRVKYELNTFQNYQ